MNLSPAIQEKVNTAEGVAGVESLSRLAQTFRPEEQEKVLQQIGDFKQNIQIEIMKRSEGDLNKLSELKQLALEGAFDTVMCKEGLCFEMPEDLKN